MVMVKEMSKLCPVMTSAVVQKGKVAANLKEIFQRNTFNACFCLYTIQLRSQDGRST